MISKRYNAILWALLGITVLTAAAIKLQASDFLVKNGPSIIVMLMVLFAWGHGFKRYGLKNTFIFVVIVFIVGNFYENLSIATTFPFGAYHYTDKLGPKFIYTPLIVNIAYFQMIYLAWNLGGAVIGYYKNIPKGGYIIVQPVIAMFITVMWDLCMDPYMSTILHNWEWHDGGAFFGVPIQNFYGWYLCTFTMFMLFSLYMSRQKDEATPAFVYTRNNWLQVTCAYLILTINLIIKGAFTVNAPVSALNGQVWQSRDITMSSGIIAVGTMLFIAVLVLCKVLLLDELSKAEK